MKTAVVRKVRKTAKEKPFLPDEIVTNILIRLKLPVKSLIRFVLVCKGWGDIILAHDFVDLHLKHSIPVILVSSRTKDYRIDLFALDKWWEFARNRLMTDRFPFNSVDFPKSYESKVRFSLAGLIVISCSGNIFILNPGRPSNECVQISVCKGILVPQICAVYYHPSLQEYVALLKMRISDSYNCQPQLVQYKLLTLGSNPSLKTITSSLKYRMIEFVDPVYINGYVYWMVMSEHGYKYEGLNDILEFDIIREEFVVIPCPVPLNTECMNEQTQLLNNDGILIFVLILPSTITIWSLEDHEENLWTSIEYIVSLQISRRRYIEFKIISLTDGMLAYEYDRRLFVCNLKEGTVKNNPKKRNTKGTSFFSHQMSLASLKNCKSEICVDKDGELLQ